MGIRGATGLFGRRNVLRSVAAVVVTAAALAVGGGVGGAQEPAPASPVAPAAPAPVTGPMLFTLTSIPNGWLIGRTDLRPLLEVQADGRAIRRPDAADPDRSANTPPQEITGTIPQEVVTAAITETRALTTLDMGNAGVSNQSSMILDYTPQQPDQDAHVIVYDPETTDGLTEEQRANRTRFATLSEKLLDAFVADR
ncbi:Uncharacterised protein [Nocardia otitidiscaviarum]|uniref:Uncharacterized protein n=2 Tax=Nocardia otitidiscaviarum TaxID=1823 RepID=A0A378YWA6_9NOCA|nr:hypothetical protein [Nocardia otitidiscaviarum]SUA80810.1 Uncharacterised protein [Nocardia otitidiscaviarum]